MVKIEQGNVETLHRAACKAAGTVAGHTYTRRQGGVSAARGRAPVDNNQDKSGSASGACVSTTVRCGSSILCTTCSCSSNWCFSCARGSAMSTATHKQTAHKCALLTAWTCHKTPSPHPKQQGSSPQTSHTPTSISPQHTTFQGCKKRAAQPTTCKLVKAAVQRGGSACRHYPRQQAVLVVRIEASGQCK